ncbi:hypothetical protein UFOVP1346_45 [uncultured Caudovirales phage]|uniref:Uncharacterized protein n=1 Tax=uncultured Caudovirales phage TaxID=2100421 RepID=A0A6J5QR81_9CAUD|nr:hypothetical protein UFOVP921_25 [uncultured Caudovirales phage]CAB4187199.1 hypothetical protein UFOVP1156_1 [uncultured Caudovirales phage]CAB4200526.1 hypothetical protein UFOVP1346_45 [uncultured Caudovirales phage]
MSPDAYRMRTSPWLDQGLDTEARLVLALQELERLKVLNTQPLFACTSEDVHEAD